MNPILKSKEQERDGQANSQTSTSQPFSDFKSMFKSANLIHVNTKKYENLLVNATQNSPLKGSYTTKSRIYYRETRIVKYMKLISVT